MRFNIKEAPRSGDRRVVKRFILFPMTLINCHTDKKERRWMEIAEIVQLYTIFGYFAGDNKWVNRAWFNN